MTVPVSLADYIFHKKRFELGFLELAVRFLKCNIYVKVCVCVCVCDNNVIYTENLLVW